MTVYLNLSSLAWAALAAFFVVRYADRWVARWFALRASDAAHNEVGTPIPDDLIAMVNAMGTGTSEGDELLRSQIVSLLHEKAAEYNGDWDKVRAWSAVNIGDDVQGWGS